MNLAILLSVDWDVLVPVDFIGCATVKMVYTSAIIRCILDIPRINFDCSAKLRT